MAIQYSLEAAQKAMLASENAGPQRIEIITALLDLASTELGKLKPHKGPPHDLPLLNSTQIPTNFAGVREYREKALTRARREGSPNLPELEALHDTLSAAENRLYGQYHIGDVPEQPVEDGIKFVLDLYPAETPQEYLEAIRRQLGLTYDEMGQRISHVPLRRSAVYSLLHRKDSDQTFKGYQQFLKGLGLQGDVHPLGSLHVAGFAVRLAESFRDEPQQSQSIEIASPAQVRKLYISLPDPKPQNLGEFMRLLRERKGVIREDIHQATGVGHDVIYGIEKGELPLPRSLFRILHFLDYMPGSPESILAVLFALDLAKNEQHV